jgi:hypothetical protein
MLQVRSFGSGRLFAGDDEINVPSREWTVPLVAYLALRPGEMTYSRAVSATR